MNKIGIFGVTIATISVAGLIWLNYAMPKEEIDLTGVGDYKNATYSIDGEKVTLKDGTAKIPSAPGSASMTVVRYFGNEAKSDMNGDGSSDVAFLLTKDGGGSGTFFYIVVAFQSESGAYTGSNAIFLGDRIAPQSTEIRDGQIVVNFAERKSGQSFAVAPSVGISRYFKIVDGTLVSFSEVRH